MIGIRAVPVRIESFVSREIADETVLVNDAGDTMHTLNETGSFIWSLIDGKRTLGDILALMREEYDLPAVGVERELEDFVRELAGRGIVRIAE